MVDMVDIEDIRNRLKNNRFVPFHCDNRYIAIELEQLLFKNGYFWPSGSTSSGVPNPFNPPLIFDINFRANKIITRSHTISHIHQGVDIVYVDKFILNNLFVIKPSYKPRRIERKI